MFEQALKELQTSEQRLEFINKIVARANKLPEPYRQELLNYLAQACTRARETAE
jgi:hypothetical protein